VPAPSGRAPPKSERPALAGPALSKDNNSSKPNLGATAPAGNRAARRRQKAEWRRRRAQWERGVLAFHEQAQGAFAARLFRVDGAPPPPDAAAGIINWCGQAATHRDVGCIVCGAVFGRDGQPQAFLVLAPYGRPATEGLVSGVCRSCAAQSDAALYEAARRQLAMVWPDLRQLSAAHLQGPGGRA